MKAHVNEPSAAEHFRPPAISLALSMMLLAAAYWTYASGLPNSAWCSLFSLALGGSAVYQAIKGLNDWDKLRDYRRRHRRHQAARGRLGQSRFATAEDILASPDFSSTAGIFLGELSTARRSTMDVCYTGEGSGSVIGVPGAQKSMAIVVPTLLNNLGQNFVCLDVSGELLSITRPALERFGYEIVVLTASPRAVSDLLGQPVVDAGVDIFSSLEPTMPPGEIRGQLDKVQGWLLPGEPEMDAEATFFLKGAKQLGSFYALEDICEGRKPTLMSMRRRHMRGMAQLNERFSELEGSTAFGGLHAELAASLGGVLRTAGPQFAGSYGVIDQALDLHDHYSEMGRHTAGSTFDPRVLRSSTKRTAVFLIPTLEMMQTYARVTAMTLSYILETTTTVTGSGRLTAVIDEAASHYLPKLADYMNFHRKAGKQRFLLIWQDLEGQAEKNYGRSGMKQILAASQYKVAMGLQDPQALEMFSKLCGRQSFSGASWHERQPAGGGLAMAESLDVREAELLRPDDIRRLQSNELLVIGSNLPPIKLRKVCYWERPQWLRLAGPSPYHQG